MKNKSPSPEKLTAAYLTALTTGTSKSTRRAYRRDLDYFWVWAQLALK